MRDQKAAEDLFLEHLGLIEQSLDRVCRRKSLSSEHAEEFKSHAKKHLIDQEYRILRLWKGESSLNTYLTVVFIHLADDYLNEIWGKWRPSAVAKRLGELAIKLDQLIHRDRESVQDAVHRLALETKQDRRSLESLANQLPPNYGRPRSDDPEILNELPDNRQTDPAENFERNRAAKAITSTLQKALVEFPEKDRVLLKLFYQEGAPAKRLVTSLGFSDERAVYRQLDHVKERLRSHLLAAGICGKDIANVLGWKDLDANLF